MHIFRNSFLLLCLLLPRMGQAQCYTDFNPQEFCVTVLKSDGTLWGWGYNSYYNFASPNDPIIEYEPIQIGSFNDIVANTNGGFNTFVIRANGSLWGVGQNTNGALGVNSSVDGISNFTQIGTGSWVGVSNYRGFSYFIRGNGTLWGAGVNDSYQMGQGSTTPLSQLSLVQITTASNYVDVVSSATGTGIALRSDGTLWGWGANFSGLLMQGSSTGVVPLPIQLGSDNQWQKISSFGAHILALKTDGSLWSWGEGGYGQAGDGLSLTLFRNTPRRVGTDTWREIATGLFSSYGIKTDGTLWAWGRNDFGQLGIGNLIDQPLPVQIGTDSNWDKVKCKSPNFAIASKTDGTLWVWGDNTYGQFGNGTSDNSSTVPVQVPGICLLSSPEVTAASAVLKGYPNPASDIITLDYAAFPEATALVWCDLTGRILRQVPLPHGETQFTEDVSAMPIGSYLTALQNKNGQIITQLRVLIAR
ncbi:T9SS type A sorting domain-containing protein [Flavobacterium sp. N1719]|uniref:RCC1 domain-containing protein n=1 Tax=Flavobacterium sp. N1719 TaxID=2885633 RepID=UPI002223A326|nr:T9SS type A sorting domain-containing protein [Flavobacterium sp. N1719]